MMTRAVLVGMVAALGISVPTWPDVQGWVKAAHSWTAHQLADWDTGARRGATGITLPAFAKPVPAFEPIIVVDEPSGLADELNRFAERVDIVRGPAVAPRMPSCEGPARATDGPVLSEFWAPPGIATPEMKGMAALLLAAEDSQGAIGSADVPVMGRRAKTRVAPAECVFTSSVLTSSAGRTAQAPSGEPGSVLVATAPGRELIEPLADAQLDIAGELNRFGEAFEIVEPAASLSPDCKPHFDPIDPGTTIDMGLAFELNRVSDGVAMAWAEVDHTDVRQPDSPHRPNQPDGVPTPTERPSPPGPSPDVAQAIRLTGQAVQAWMKVMVGPAVVQVSVR
jgi:hypothetical protein